LKEEEIKQALLTYFRRKIPHDGKMRITAFDQPSSGWSDEIFSLDLQWQERERTLRQSFVIRKHQKRGLMSDEHDLSTQFKVLQILSLENILPLPKVYWYEEDETVLGSRFFVMEKLPGRSYVPWSSEGRRFFEQAYEHGEIPRQFVTFLARLHQIDYQALGLDKVLVVPEQGTGYIDRKLHMLERLYEKYRFSPDPVFVDALEWLKKHRPPAQRYTLIHGDYRTGNMLYDQQQITGILDWELVEIGDPMVDVAYVCAKANRMDSPRLCYLLDREWFLQQYQELTGLQFDEKVLHYYEVFHQMRFALISLAAAKAFVGGGSDDLRMARQGYRWPLMRHMIAEMLGY
jgi:aminoglycoside phosphotransferase (APT) family kinase protein